MHEIALIGLDNEMDVILSHKRSMRLAELAGFTLSGQTAFATAVSEVARTVYGAPHNILLTLCILQEENIDFIIARISGAGQSKIDEQSEGYLYAKKLIKLTSFLPSGDGVTIEIKLKIPGKVRIRESKIEFWKTLFLNDPPVSPYEEIKRKNLQLLRLSSQLANSERNYRVLTNSLPIMIYSLANNGELLYANKWMKQYFGKTVANINLKGWLDLVHPDDYDTVVAAWEEFKPQKKIVYYEHRLRNEAGQYLWHKAYSSPIIDENGEVQYWTGYVVDVDASKIVEETLQFNKELTETKMQLEEKISELNRSNFELEQFAYVASHDLQEPLRKLIYYSDFLQTKFGEQIGADGKGYLDKMIAASTRMKLLITDLLSFSRIDKDEKQFVQVQLAEVAQEALQDLEITIQEKNASISIGPLPEVDGNTVLLRQLFENLLSNSLKYTAVNTVPQISINARLDGGYIEITFTDNGIGFDEKHISRMFSLFQRLHTRDKYSGTGIGLALCKKIVDLHHGEITATSTPGVTSFIVRLPLRQATI